MPTYRKEHDILGEVDLPVDVYYGSFTLRARDNFQISHRTIQSSFIETLALVKKASAFANHHVRQTLSTPQGDHQATSVARVPRLEQPESKRLFEMAIRPPYPDQQP